MVTTLKIVDEYFGAGVPGARRGAELRVASERVSGRDIIRSKVAAEVEALRQRPQTATLARSHSFIIDMPPTAPEMTMNPMPSIDRPGFRPPEMEQEVLRAFSAFARGGFIMLLDGRQICDLDEELVLRPESEAVFLNLTPLQGG
ncbi:hypothetical protein [Zavarzinia aquatilis]|uniref:Uncharacterized protein n=1 Tax=Zavarzinia aquatilis TaxID=2211142 RepID=A0A317EBS6_9PROT|nr:hypothetical protein [Zavarzinia aquatilis]PWR24517.1 hypothetical protein DKG74_06850 [Zavarzinia aquatilis]